MPGGRCWGKTLDSCLGALTPARSLAYFLRLAVTQWAPAGVAWQRAALHSSPCSSPRKPGGRWDAAPTSQAQEAVPPAWETIWNFLGTWRMERARLPSPRAPPGGQMWEVPRFPFEEGSEGGCDDPVAIWTQGPSLILSHFPCLSLWCEKMP